MDKAQVKELVNLLTDSCSELCDIIEDYKPLTAKQIAILDKVKAKLKKAEVISIELIRP